MSEVKLKNSNWTNEPTFITGMTRSGKILLLPIVASFKNSEKVNVDFFFEQVPFVHHVGKIPEDGAIYLLQAGLNLKIYDNAIGRNVNFRPDDYTSVLKFQEPRLYFERLFIPDGDSVFERIEKEKKLFPMMLHNGLWHADLFIKAFPKMKMIHMARNPIDIIFSWMKKGYGGEFYNNKRAGCLTLEYKNNLVPYYAFGWEEEYLSLSNTDRIVRMVQKIRMFHQESYNKLSEKRKNKILIINHEVLATTPEKEMPEILNFLNTEVSEHTDRIMEQEQCPRKMPTEEREQKFLKIKQKCSEESVERIEQMLGEFNNFPI